MMPPINTNRGEPDLHGEMTCEPEAYCCGQWLPQSQLMLPIDDLGFRQGVTAVERLRTYDGGVLFELDEHLRRFASTTSAIGISGLPDAASLQSFASELIHRNQPWIAREGEFGMTWFATPGIPGKGKPTLAMHLNRLDLSTYQNRRDHGQPLVVCDIQSPPNSCWPRSAKVRSRIHYYLADQLARQRHPDAVGVLIDQDGSVTESSIANIAVVQSGTIVSPEKSQVLGGITQVVCQRIAQAIGIPWRHERISMAQLKSSDEVLLMGTDTGVWFANQVDNEKRSAPTEKQVCRMLQNAFAQQTQSN